MFLLESDDHPIAMFITAFDMGSHDVLQVLGRSGRVNVVRIICHPDLGPKNAIKPFVLTATVPRLSCQSINGLITSPAADLAVLDAAVEAFAGIVERARKYDSCLDLSISVDSVDPDHRINLFECWRD